MEHENLKDGHYLFCERRSVFFLMMMNSGMMGAYTFTQRGGVFCNAQTANIVLMSIAFGQGKWKEAFYFLIPMSAYILGAFVSETLPTSVKRHWGLRWDTILVGLELVVLFVVGFIPLTVDDKIVQVIINFLASMQYNTFRQAEGIPMATTFCTNHVRQVGIALAKRIHKKDKSVMPRLFVHVRMLSGFFLGGAVVSALGSVLGAKSIWMSILPLSIVLINLVYADRKTEKDEMERKPHGH